MTWLDRADYLAAIPLDGAALADASEGRLADPVPSCPGWTVSDLVFHVAGVHYFWGEVVRRRAKDQAAVDEIPPSIDPSDDDLLTWYRSGLERLMDTLAAADPTQPIWTWTPSDERVAWVQRRMAQETAVHRADAELSAGDPHPGISPHLAADGVSEFLVYMLPDGEGLEGPVDTVSLQASDVGREWIVRVGDGELTVAEDPATAPIAQAALRAPVSDLLLMLWRRSGTEGAQVSGDAAIAERFLGRAELD